MEKINIAELLKDCPQGMELDSPLFENLEFDHIDYSRRYSIICRVKSEWGGYNVHTFTEYGCFSTEKYAKCVIFPKGKTTWEGFHRPFKDGDIVVCGNNICIFKEWGDKTLFTTHVSKDLSCSYLIDIKVPFFGKSIREETRFATEEEKQKLFKAIKDNGYKWNAETKTLEKLVESKFKDGDIVFYDNYVGIFKEWGNETLFRSYVDVNIAAKTPVLCYNTCNFGEGIKREARLATERERQKLFQAIKDNGRKWNAETKTLEKLVKPKFKAGDRIKNKHINKNDYYPKYTIKEVYDNYYKTDCGTMLFEWQDDYELVPNKFDITTLKPFDKVLVRDSNESKWSNSFYSRYVKGDYPFHCIYFGSFKQCIPYKGNEYLFDTTQDCDEYYKIW